MCIRDRIETQYDHLQKEELKLHVQTEKNHELCKEKEAYFEKLRIYEEAGEVYDKIRMQRKEYRDRLSDWQDRYDCNQAGLLARNLIDGHPCPCLLYTSCEKTSARRCSSGA